jgi:hypothetical protein
MEQRREKALLALDAWAKANSEASLQRLCDFFRHPLVRE